MEVEGEADEEEEEEEEEEYELVEFEFEPVDALLEFAPVGALTALEAACC